MDSKEAVFKAETHRENTLEKVPRDINNTVPEGHREPRNVACHCEHKV
jgi:hypothetical protein